MKKANELVRFCNVNLGLIIRKKKKYYTYHLTDQEFWPSTISNIISKCNVNNELSAGRVIENFIHVAYQSVIYRL